MLLGGIRIPVQLHRIIVNRYLWPIQPRAV